MWKAALIFFSNERKNLVSELKNSPKVKQTVVVLFLLAGAAPLAAADQPELLRLEKSADAMGSAYTVEVYGYDRVKMEAAADAALDEAHRLTSCFPTISRGANGARSTSTRPKSR